MHHAQFKTIFSAFTLQVAFSTWLQTAILMRQEEKSFNLFWKLYLIDVPVFEQTELLNANNYSEK